MTSRAVTNFMKQQGFAAEPPDACDMHFEGLYFQPRIVFPAVIVAILLQLVSVPASAGLHLALSAVLWWNTLLPALQSLRARLQPLGGAAEGAPGPRPRPGPPADGSGHGRDLQPRGRPRPPPRDDAPRLGAARPCLVAGFSALLFGRFCLGAYVYHLLKGRVAFANSTLPWA